MRTEVGVKSKKRMLLGAACLFFIFLTSCGVSDYDTTTLEMNKDGTVTLHIREDFNENLYDIDELAAMNEEEVKNYNATAGEDEVIIKKCKLSDGKIAIDILYKEDNDYYNMNGNVLFYGSCDVVRGAGYNLVGKVRSISDGKELDQKTWKSMSDQNVVIVSETIDLDLPSDILYMGEGVTMKGSNRASVDTNGSSNLCYVICK